MIIFSGFFLAYLVILEISGVFGHFRYFGDIWSFEWFLSIFGNFRDFGSILVILEVLGYFWSFEVCFNYFNGFGVF